MFSAKVENERGDILDLTNNENYIVYKIEGLTPPQAIINKAANTTRDGSKIGSTRIESRNIVIYMTIEGDVEENRINLYHYFPIKRKINFYYKNGCRDVKISGCVELIECDLFAEKEVAQISIICEKPYFENMKTIITDFSQVQNLFEFPFSIPESGVEFSTIVSDVRKSIVNAGEVSTGTIIKLFATAKVENPVIYDVLKKQHMKLNSKMQEADLIVINTNTGEKSITLFRNGLRVNIIGEMEKDSSWLELEPGENVFAFKCDSGESSLQITFTTAELYAGV